MSKSKSTDNFGHYNNKLLSSLNNSRLTNESMGKNDHQIDQEQHPHTNRQRNQQKFLIHHHHSNNNQFINYIMYLQSIILMTFIIIGLIIPIKLISCDPSSSSSASLSSPSTITISASSPIASPLTSINFRCPEQFGYYADEFNCSKYFVCVFGEALHESCTGGLRFSSELQTCDWPRNVICPYEDSDYDETEDDFSDSGAYPSSNNKHVGSGMIIESKTVRNITTTTTTTTPMPKTIITTTLPPPPPPSTIITTAKPLLSLTSIGNSNTGVNNNNNNNVIPDPFIILNHKSQPYIKSILSAINNDSSLTIQRQQQYTPTQQNNGLLFSTLTTTKLNNNKLSVNFNHNQNNNNNQFIIHQLSHHNNSPIWYQQQQQPQTTRYTLNKHPITVLHINDNNPNQNHMNEHDLIQDSFNKLIKQQQQQHAIKNPGRTLLNQQQQQSSSNKSTNNQFDFIKQNIIHNSNIFQSKDHSNNNNNYIDIENVPDLDGNKLNFDINNNNTTHRHHQQHDRRNQHQHIDDLEENFTLVDLQRSHHHHHNNQNYHHTHNHHQNSNNNNNNPKPHHHLHHRAGHNNDDDDHQKDEKLIRNDPVEQINQNLLGRSVNGGNRAQSVSVVASTSSRAIIPKLDIVFKNDDNIAQNDKIILSNDNPKQPIVNNNNNNNNNNRLLIDEILQLANAFNNDHNDGKFDDVITAIVDENGAIHLAGSSSNNEDSQSLLQLLSSKELKNQLYDRANDASSPGLAASNRNTASQQLLYPDGINNSTRSSLLLLPNDRDKYQTSHDNGNLSHNSKNQPQPKQQIMDTNHGDNLDFDAIEPGAILIYNKTKLIVVPELYSPINNRSTNKNQNNSSSIIPDYILSQTSLTDENKPRQLITRTDKESNYLYQINKNFSTIENNSKERPFHKIINKSQTSSFAQAATDFNDNDDESAEILSANPEIILNDFQRIGVSKNLNETDSQKRRVIEYRHINSTASTAQSTINNLQRLSYTKHIGTHNRGAQKLSSSNATRVGKNFQIPSRPVPMFKTPEPLSNAIKCNENLCKLPDCFCGGTEIPGGLPVKDVPQLVLISFDDAVNDVNWQIYEELLNSGRSNPNGCPIKATFYVSHEWTDYSQVQTLYSRGHEIASHSITHSFGESYSKQQWHKEIVGQREILHLYGGVNKADIRGMRAPFLQAGGNKQFEMLHDENFTYDSSMPVFENSPPFWPYTLDYAINHECMIAPCPTKSFPGLWEIGLVMWQDLRGGRCSMGDACSNPSDENGVYELIMKNFKRHYNSNRAPFGLYYHSAWFNSEHHRTGFIRVIDDLLTYYKDVYFVTKWELIQWIRNPTPLKELYRVNLFGCARDPHRPPPCLHPNICNVGSNSGSRFLKTCQPCPKRYPWLDDNGQ